MVKKFTGKRPLACGGAGQGAEGGAKIYWATVEGRGGGGAQ